MLRIVLLLRICLILTFSFFLLSCVKKVRPVELPAGGGVHAGTPVGKNCPPNLFDLKELQLFGGFLNCDPEKDGTSFVDEKNLYPVPPEHQPVWLLIDTQKQQLEVKRGDDTLLVFPNISIGRAGAGFKSRRGDDITPVGEYKIGWINEQSQFHIFYGLTYPSTENAAEALKKGLISDSEYQTIIYAHQHNLVPPQHTALGGMVGLHGLGVGDEKIHGMINWTHGCIALTNKQINELDPWIVKGMRVKIQ